jgi:hypothetical protein
MSDEAELTPKNIERINHMFYGGTPWTYFQFRLGHLVLANANDERWREALAEGVDIDGIEFRFDAPASSESFPTPRQSFVAVELEVLLHHAAETLLRFVHAHANPDEPCPSIRMARLTNAGQFKKWAREDVRDASDSSLAELCAVVFACPTDADAVATYADYLKLYARHFLDSDSYNAAKHGMALQGGMQRTEVTVNDWQAISEDGAQVSWIARWPQDDPDRPKRWTRAAHLLSEGAVVGLIHMACALMENIWARARARYLSDEFTEMCVSPPEMLFEALGVRRHVLIETFHPFAPEGEPELLVFKTPHLRPPPA